MSSEPNPLGAAAALKGRGGLARICNAAGYSLAGLKAAYAGEAAFRQLVWLNLLLIPWPCCSMSAASSARC